MHIQTIFARKLKNSRGLTMIELLIVIAILALLIIILMWFLRNQPHKARDAKRKADLKQYQVAFEDYFNDNESYPPDGAIDNCSSGDLRPYVPNIICDPRPGNNPYDYIVGTDGTWFAICADLENDSDPDIYKIGCQNGCGTGLDYDYCAVEGIAPSDIGGASGGGGSTTGTFEGNFACDPSGVCNNYADPEGAGGCPQSWAESDCNGLCTLPANTSMPPAIPNPAYSCTI
jgi:prepilin-type N-terminal cleavage/methylation domain-containing protein